jgi:hypothetical protein
MMVYDRWGGLMSKDLGPPFRWEGKKALPGVYLIVFRYFNLRTQQIEVFTQDVLLLR